MNTDYNYNLGTAAVATPTRFETEAIPAGLTRGHTETELEQFKERLLGQLALSNAPDTLRTTLRQAADEAAALVWLTPFPLLWLPALLEEKTAAARQKVALQARIRQQSSDLLTLAE